MKVEFVAHTQPDAESIEKFMKFDENATDLENLPEFAGRVCYQSFDKPNEKTRSNEDYLRNIVKQKHFSVLEHSSLTVYIEDVSRSFTHELIRHRHFSFSQLSQRFVTNPELAVHPTLKKYGWEPELRLHFKACLEAYNRCYEALRKRGLNKKQAAEAAREFLPNATETKILVTGNLRTWREFLEKRLSPAADAQIREVAHKIWFTLDQNVPAVFSDLHEIYCPPDN